MSSLNKVMLIGHAGRDVELKYMPSGDAVANVSLATTESWKDKSSGERKEETTWHNLTFYRKLGEIAAQYVKKGDAIYVEGKIKTRKYTKDGVEKYVTDIIVDEMKMLNSKSQDRTDRPAAPAGGDGGQVGSGKQAKFDDFIDDIPF